MSPELLNFIITLVTVFVGFLVNRWANKNKIKEIEMSQKELEQRLELEKKEAKEKSEEHDAGLSEKFLGIAKASGEQVISRDLTIKELQTAIVILQKQVTDLISDKKKLEEQVNELIRDKRKLEDESIRKDERIQALETDNQSLRCRIEVLEGTLKSDGKVIPPCDD